MTEEIALSTSRDGELVETIAQPCFGPTTEQIVLHILGGVIGGALLCSIGFLGLVTYVSLSKPAEPQRLVCPPICKVEAR